VKLKDILNRIFEETATVQTAQQAREMGLFPAPYGKWTDKSGRIVAYTRNGELRMVNDNPTADIDNGEDLFKDRNDNDERAKAISMGNPTTPKPDIFNKVSTAVRPMDAARKTTKTKLSEILQWILESESSDQAHQLGLRYNKWGYWKDKTGKTVAQTVNGKLVKLPNDFDEKSMKDPDASQQATEPAQAPEGPSQENQPQPISQAPQMAPKKGLDNPISVLSFTKNESVDGMTLNGIPFTPWAAPIANKDTIQDSTPEEIAAWQGIPGTNPQIDEPPFTYNGKALAAGIVMVEPDGRVWVIEPKGHYGGYSATFPKGRLDKTLTPQESAIKEAYEESGLQAEILDYLGDFERSTTTSRYYLGKRVGGTPTAFGGESQGVHLVPLDKLDVVAKHHNDAPIIQALKKKLNTPTQPPVTPTTQPQQSQKLTAEQIMAEPVKMQTGGTTAPKAYKGTDGKIRYVKHYNDPSKCSTESLACEMYRNVSLNAPKTQTFESNGKRSFASENVPGTRLDHWMQQNGGLSKEMANKILDGFVMDVFTSNVDSIGLVWDNMMITPEGDISRIDNGGSFMFRATEASGRKDPNKFKLYDIAEWDTLLTHNPNYSQVFKKAGYSNADELGQRAVQQIKPIIQLYKQHGNWANYVESKAPEMNSQDKQEIVKMLDARFFKLVLKYNQLMGGT
jgi:8-oxo-dGTP pyrophosphatase MutT (NUDIX family)